MLENLDYYSANELIVNTFAFLQKIFDDFEVLAQYNYTLKKIERFFEGFGFGTSPYFLYTWEPKHCEIELIERDSYQ